MKKFLSMILMLCLLAGFGYSRADDTDLSDLYKNRDVDASWEASEAVYVELAGSTCTLSGSGAAAEGSDLVISREGTYVLSGSWDGRIVIRADESEKVRLVLNGVKVTSTAGPALLEESADKLILTLEEGTENVLTASGSTLVESKEVTSGLYTEDDLSINGEGSLSVTADGHGLQVKADLILSLGTLNVTSGGDGIRAKNSLLLLAGDLSITSEGDGISTTNTEKEDKGWIILAGGSVTVRTGSGAGEAAVNTAGAWNQRGGRGWNTSTASTASDDVSRKGIKAATSLTVLDGTLDLDAQDDGLHAVNIAISGGNITIRTGDDGVHADETLEITGSNLTVAQSNEGLEGNVVQISGGVLHITATDDGINAAGGSDSTTSARNREADQGNVLNISGGDLTVEAGADGLDSNGRLSLTGGVIRVYAPTTMGDGSVDMNGNGSINGATLIIASSNGVMQDVGSLSGQALVRAMYGQSAQAGAEIVLSDASGNVLATYAPGSSYDTVVVSAPGLESGSSVTVSVGGSVVFSGNASQNSVTTTNGNGQWGGQGGGFGHGGFGGGRGGRGGW